MSHVSCFASPISRLLSHVSCLTSPVSRLLSHSPASHLLSHVICLTSPVSRLLFHISCETSPVSCLTSPPVSCLLFFIFCIVSCLMSHVSCVPVCVYSVTMAFSSGVCVICCEGANDLANSFLCLFVKFVLNREYIWFTVRVIDY